MIVLLLQGIACFVCLVASLWMAGGLYFDLGRGTWLGRLMAIGWIILVALLFYWWHPIWRPITFTTLAFLGFLWWWLSQRPSQDRNWDPNFSRPARVHLSGDDLTLENVRNTEYRSKDDFTTRYETRQFHLSRLCGLDALILYWGSKYMCHPMFVFDFGTDGRVCFSIEVRYRLGQPYDFLRSLYRQQELMYVVCDERDAILRRTKCLEGHDMYLYRMDTSPIPLRSFFFEYANRINQLAEKPHWYHGITSNCTTSIYAQGRGRMKWDWRLLFNGTVDRMLYAAGRFSQKTPFEELKTQSYVNEVANRAPAVGFGEFIRRELPGYQL